MIYIAIILALPILLNIVLYCFSVEYNLGVEKYSITIFDWYVSGIYFLLTKLQD